MSIPGGYRAPGRPARRRRRRGGVGGSRYLAVLSEDDRCSKPALDAVDVLVAHPRGRLPKLLQHVDVGVARLNRAHLRLAEIGDVGPAGVARYTDGALP